MSCHLQIALVSLVIMTFPASTGRYIDKKGICMFGKLFVVRVVLHEIDLLDIYIYIEI